MAADRFPSEFEDLLSREGRRVLAGTHALCGALADPRTRFLADGSLLQSRKVATLRGLLDHTLLDRLEPIDRPVPPESIWSMTEDYAELLPKTTRVLTAYFESRRERAWAAAERIGLMRMMRSASFHAFAEAMAGRGLATGWGLQVLCYRAGDYSGPHNDHHPGNPKAKAGYIDVHLGLNAPAIAHQYLVYAKAGHFSHSVAVAGAETGSSMVTAYRLPFWHYTTPLVARPGEGAHARRWVLLGTFLYA
jgi:hypothetical protein